MEKPTVTARTGIRELDLFKRLINSDFKAEDAYAILMDAKDKRDTKLPDKKTIIIYQVQNNTFTVIGVSSEYPNLLKPLEREDYMSKKEISIMDYTFPDGTKFTLNQLSIINDCKRDPRNEYAELVLKLIDTLIK